MESVQYAAPVDISNEAWKEKKNYGPATLFTVLLLGTAFLAGNSYAADYGRTAPILGSLLAMGGLSTVGKCGYFYESGVAPKDCPPGQEFWSVAGMVDDDKCLFDTGTTPMCGEFCVGSEDTNIWDELAMYFSNNNPMNPYTQGSCRSHGYTAHAGKNMFDDFLDTEVFVYVKLV